MNINVLNKQLKQIEIIDAFTSLMWGKRYNDIGALDLEVEATRENLNIFKQGYYITRDDDDAIFKIDALEITTDDEGNNKLIVGAVDCKNILSQRIVRNVINHKGTVKNLINRMINENIIEPTDTKRKINNFAIKNNQQEFIDEIEMQVTYDVLSEKIIELCEAYGYGWRVILDNGFFKFELYKGLDRSVNQSINNKIIFSPEYDNLITSKYKIDYSDFKNAAIVGGEGEGKDRIIDTVGTAAGLDRFELFVDASSISQNEEMDRVDYHNALINEGKNKLAENALTSSFEAETNNDIFIYKQDYNLGDIITIKNELGIQADARITEIIETWDAEGYTIEPKFDFINDIETGAILTENDIALMTENDINIIVETE